MLKFIVGTAVFFMGVSGLAAELPKDLEWQSNDNPASIAAKKVEKGGEYRGYLDSFPLTLRNVGPDSNGAFRYFYDRTTLPLIEQHPNTEELYGLLAEKWAFSKDNKAAFYKIRKNATWSDGKPVTADDFVYVLEFMRSEHLVAPWYNQYYSEHFDKVVKYDDHTIGIFLHKPTPELFQYANLAPVAKHFYHPLDKDYVKKYNWKAQVTTGAYHISKIRKGKAIEIAKVKNWWAESLPIFKNRFNIERITLEIVRDENLAFQKFLKGDIGAFALVKPDLWHDKSKAEEFDRGLINKLWFFTDKPEAAIALEINSAKDILKDKNVRLGIAHAVNIELVLDKVLRGDFERQHTTSSGYGDFSNTEIRAREYSLDKANEYFEKAGFTKRGADGIRLKGTQRLSAKISYSNKESTPRLVVMKQQLKKAGFEANLHQVDGALGFKHHLEKKHDIAYTGWGAMARPQYFGRFHSSNANKPQTNNFTNTTDEKLDKMIEDYRAAETLKEKTSLSKKIQAYIHELAVLVPLWETPYHRIGYWRYFQLPEVPATKTTDVYSFDPLDLLSYSTGGLAWVDKALQKKVRSARTKATKFPVVNVKDETYKK